MKKIIYVLIFILLLIGSHNYRDLNNIAIITNISIEKYKSNYKITFQEIIPKRNNHNIKYDYKYYTNINKDLKNAFNEIDTDITKDIYLEHLENIVIKGDELHTIKKIESILNTDLDNFNIIITETNPEEIIKYSNNYKYINKIIKNNTTLRSIKRSNLEHNQIKVPVLKIDNKKLIFYKYKKIGES